MNKEEWFDKYIEDRQRDEFFYYDESVINEMWLAVKAYSNSLSINIPENCKGHAITVKEFIEAVESAGVKVVK